MSRAMTERSIKVTRFPCASGDEPSWHAEAYSRVAFSPRERG